MRNLINSWKYLFPLAVVVMSVVLPTQAQEQEEPAKICKPIMCTIGHYEAICCLEGVGNSSMTCECGTSEIIDH